MGSGGSTNKKFDPQGAPGAGAAAPAAPSPAPAPPDVAGQRVVADQQVPRPPPAHAVPPKREAWGLQAAAAGEMVPLHQGPPVGSALGEEGLALAADVGGTNSRFMLYRVDVSQPIVKGQRAPGRLLAEKKYTNLRYSSFEAVFEAFISDTIAEGIIPAQARPCVACLAVAGVVEANVCRLTNLDWIIDGPELEERFGIQCVEVINDFVAQGYGVLTLGTDELIHIFGPEAPLPGAPMACVGAGTGLGQCFLTAGADGEYTAFPSEGGHAEFAPRGAGNDETQIELLRYLKVKFSGWNRISFERVVSGKGICNTYEFLAYKSPGRIDKKVHQEFLTSRQNAGIVAQNALPGTLCLEALEIFADCYGAVCGTFALQVMPFGGFYLSGGVTQKLMSFLKDSGNFLEAYHDKGRVSPMLQDIPLYFVKGDDMGQRGAHLRAVRLCHIWLKPGLLPEDKVHQDALQRTASGKVKDKRAVTLVPPRNAGFADFVRELAPGETAADPPNGGAFPAVRCSTPT